MPTEIDRKVFEQLVEYLEHMSLKSCQKRNSFNVHLLSTYYVPGTVLDAGDTKMNKTWSLSPRSLQSLGGKQVVQRHRVYSKVDKSVSNGIILGL